MSDKLKTSLRGQGEPWDQIMENEFDYLSDRGGHGGQLAEKILKKKLKLILL